MTYFEWPLALPYRPWRDQWGNTPGREALVTEMEGGDTRQRRRPADDVGTMQWGRSFSEAEMATWDDFLLDISSGAARFLMPVPTTGATYQTRVVQIVGGAGGISYSAVGIETQVSFSLLVFPSDMVPLPEITLFDYFILGTGIAGWTVDVEIDGVVRSAAVATDGAFEIDGSDLSPGTYSVRVRHGNGVWSAAEDYTIAAAVLDAFAADLYSASGLKLLLSSYVGSPCARVRRSSDGLEADIGFGPDRWISTDEITAHCGSGSGYVTRWYDQSGNGRRWVQASGPSQARIYNAGVLDVGPNEKPMLVFSGTQSYSPETAGFARNASNVTVALAGASTAPGASGAFFTASRAAPNISWYRLGLLCIVGTSARFSASANDADNPPLASRSYTAGTWARMIGRARFTAGNVDFAIDGTTTTASLGTTTPSLDSYGQVFDRIGASPNGGSPLTGPISCMVLSRSALDVAALDTALQGVMS
ncbi:hypothetical protein [Ancylobacter sp. IITR112]|uniref:hypothetical protein n=1 Tax=Ancylobacter sp. IITR112 TaxID=3138073 RepID=UPI00352BC23E